MHILITIFHTVKGRVCGMNKKMISLLLAALLASSALSG